MQFKESFKEVLRKFHIFLRLYKGFSDSDSFFFKELTRSSKKKCQGCFKRLSKVFQGSSKFQENDLKKFDVVCHSSLLPVQKEGLFYNNGLIYFL